MELQVQDQSKARSLQIEAGRIYRQRVVPLIDKYCTELSEPDRIHRIESLAVDVGTINPQRFEVEFMAKLSVALRESLATQIGEREWDAGGRGQTVPARSQLEALELFARTGHLPWWADLSQPRPLHSILRSLFRAAPGPLACLVRQLAREARALKRLVINCDEEALLELGCLLTPHLKASLGQFPSKLTALLDKRMPVTGGLQGRHKYIVWLAVLRTACLDQRQQREPSIFWREVLLRISSASSVTYSFLVAGIHRRVRAKSDGASAQLSHVTEPLLEELQREDGGLKKLIRILEHLQRSGGPLGGLSAVLRPHVGHLTTAVRAELLAVLMGGLDSRREIANGLMQTLGGAVGQGGLQSTAVRPGPGENTRAEETTERPTQAFGGAVEQGDFPPYALRQFSAESIRTEGITKAVIQTLSRAAEQGLMPRPIARRLLGDLQETQTLGLPVDLLSRLTAKLQEVTQEGLPSDARADRPVTELSFSEADELCIDNAGLVILWPFLEHFFERLDLLAARRFKETTDVQRAVGLLQMLVTEDSAPLEHLLPLNKVLCGMELAEVFDFGPPVTPTEAEECNSLLTAVLERAPILKDMSPSGFRATFLLRQGILGTRDGAWLLRVERETYDVVLDRFPWNWEWVKLPWMAAPLRVEW